LRPNESGGDVKLFRVGSPSRTHVLDAADRIGRAHDHPCPLRHRRSAHRDDRGCRDRSKLDRLDDAIADELGGQRAAPPHRGTRPGKAKVVGDELHEGQELDLLARPQRFAHGCVASLELPEADEEIERINHGWTCRRTFDVFGMGDLWLPPRMRCIGHATIRIAPHRSTYASERCVVSSQVPGYRQAEQELPRRIRAHAHV
jgi:hypothetical protein